MSFGGFGYGDDPENRKQKRREIKKARRKEKERQAEKDKRKENRKVKQKWRKLNDGGIAYGNSFKIGRGGLICFSVIGVFAVFMAFAMSTVDVDEAGECVSPFCNIGKFLFEEKEVKPEIPMEDRDFLPPSEFLIPFAEARGEDEPKCYTAKACEKLDEIENKKDDDPKKEATVDERNQAVVDKKAEVEKLKSDLQRDEEELRDKIIERSDKVNDRNTFQAKVKNLEDDFERMEKKYESERDSYQATEQEKQEFEELEQKYLNLKKDYERAIFDYERAENDVQRLDDEIDNLRNSIRVNELVLPVLLDELSEAKFKANIIHRDHQFFSIILSQTCMKMIEGGFNEKKTALVDETGWVYGEIIENKCPTYEQLHAMFDNTVPFVSGGFVENESGTDIMREPSGYKNYWKYYQQLGSWKIIAVDPDAEWKKRSVVIEVQANEFRYAEKLGSSDKTLSYTPLARYVNGTLVEPKITTFNNVQVYDKCNGAMVAPDVDLIAQTINYFLEECSEDLHPRTANITMLNYFDNAKAQLDSAYYGYMNWLGGVMETCLVKC